MVTKTKPKKLDCGLIMPISVLDGCTEEHWGEVKSIIIESVTSISDYIFSVNIVSDADEVGVIQKRIVQNVYKSDIVICDVSGKNPNVMFELGMRLAFDKPTIIVKDDKTDYSFDTGIIEHITYPRDLRFAKIILFKTELANKVKATYSKSISDPEHSTFLKNFGKFQVANLSEEVVSSDEVVINMLNNIQMELSALRSRSTRETAVFHQKIPIFLLLDDVIARWIDESKCEIKDLFQNSEFYDFAENYIKAPDHFKNREDFIKAIEKRILKRMK